jgi:Zn-dependent protease
MSADKIADGLMFYVGLIVLLTFHEFGHAWMALKCGDDTAKQQGRVSLNPLVHMDLVGTVLLPLFMIFGSMAFSGLPALFGWAKPVPVNPHNLKNPKVDDILVTLAGPWMNLVLAVILMGFAKVTTLGGMEGPTTFLVGLSYISLILCFFNMIPVPPLDGSQVVRVLTGMSYETFANIARYSWIALLILINLDFVWTLLGGLSAGALRIIAGWFNVPMG